ncbi:ABC transporter substrate-binding protein, partial [bacterium]|nr:ABC transporter substrate-binding protein [candidate division CSSED10-310 bacterium]
VRTAHHLDTALLDLDSAWSASGVGGSLFLRDDLYHPNAAGHADWAARLVPVIASLPGFSPAAPVVRDQGDAIPLRFGYSAMTNLLVHLGTVFSRTDILEEAGFSASMTVFQRGDAQASALARQDIDATFTSGLATLVNLHQLPGLRVVASVGPVGRLGLVVPRTGSVRAAAELRGARVGLVPMSSADYGLWRLLRPAGMTESDVEIVTMEHTRQAVEHAFRKHEIAAAVIWDPLLEALLEEGSGRLVTAEPYHGHLVMAGEYLDRYPGAAGNIRRALAAAFAFMASQPVAVQTWAAAASGWRPELFTPLLAANDRISNARTGQAIDPEMTDDEKQWLRDAADWYEYRTGERIAPGGW